MVPDGIRLNYEDLLVIGQGGRNEGNENRSICLQAHKIFAGHSGIFECGWVGVLQKQGRATTGKTKCIGSLLLLSPSSGIRKTIG